MEAPRASCPAPRRARAAARPSWRRWPSSSAGIPRPRAPSSPGPPQRRRGCCSSRSTLRANFTTQYSTWLLGSGERTDSAAQRCQKHPLTNSATRLARPGHVGMPGHLPLQAVARKAPPRAAAPARRSSGLVFWRACCPAWTCARARSSRAAGPAWRVVRQARLRAQRPRLRVHDDRHVGVQLQHRCRHLRASRGRRRRRARSAALSSPLATTRILRARMMVPMPMV